MGKEAATPSRTWQLLSSARPEMVLFLAVTAKQQAVEQKIKNYLTKWRQVQQKLPLPEMTELLITPQLPEYPKIAHDVFMLLLDGKLRSRTETSEIPEAVCATTAAATSSAAPGTRSRRPRHKRLRCFARRHCTTWEARAQREEDQACRRSSPCAGSSGSCR